MNKHMRKLRKTSQVWLTALAAFGLVSTPGVRACDVSGTIVNQTWTTNCSPYRVVGNILVADLTINPGVTVLFTNNYTFEVAGRLKANGTATAPIVFMGTNGGWQGIYFNQASPGSVLNNCVISNSVNSGIRVYNTSLNINNCLIANNSNPVSGGGINANLATNYVLNLEGCVISVNVANPSGAVEESQGGGVYVSGNAILQHCT